MNFKTYTKIIRTKKNIQDNSYTLLNNTLDIKLTINESSYDLITNATNSNGKISPFYYFIPNCRSFFKELTNLGVLVDNGIANPLYINCVQDSSILPLTSLNIELTHSCNLRCIHCYGSFGTVQKPTFISFNQVKDLLPDLLSLGTMNISLTGGECLLNPDFEKIALFFLQNGFNLWILSNGYYTDKLIEFTKKTTQFKYTIKISLDGLYEEHTKIRGVTDSFEKTIETLDHLYKQENISLYISSTLMKSNFEQFHKLNDFVKNRFPNAIHSLNLIFPDGNAIKTSQCFSQNELSLIEKKFPNLFVVKESEKSKYRCSGGITQCTLTPDGNLKICNAACDNRFMFASNVFETSLKYAWIHCGDNINFYRNELDKSSEKCFYCKYKQTCYANNCRIMAYLYTGSEFNNSPLACITAKHMEGC